MSLRHEHNDFIELIGRDAVVYDDGSTRLSKLPVCQTTYGGYIACVVCACYLAVDLLKVPRRVSDQTLGKAIKTACYKWRNECDTTQLLTPYNAIESISSLGSTIRVQKDYTACVRNLSDTRNQRQEETFAIKGFYELLMKLDLEHPEGVALVITNDSSAILLHLWQNRRYLIADSHGVFADRKSRPLAMIHESRTLDEMLQFFFDRYCQFQARSDSLEDYVPKIVSVYQISPVEGLGGT